MKSDTPPPMICRCRFCSTEYETRDRQHHLNPEARECPLCRQRGQRGSMSELWTDFIQHCTKKIPDDHPMWIDIVEVFGQDGETRAEVLYKRLEATGLKHPDLAGLPHRAVAERCKEDEILIMDVEALVRFARRYQNRWQDCDILQVVRKIKKAGFYDSEKFAQMMVDSFTEACGSDPYSGRFRRLFPDLLNVETVNDKAVALAAIYATYEDENNESLNMGGGLRAKFQELSKRCCPLL